MAVVCTRCGRTRSTLYVLLAGLLCSTGHTAPLLSEGGHYLEPHALLARGAPCDIVRDEPEPTSGNVLFVGWDGVGRDHLAENIARAEVPSLMALAAEGALAEVDVTTGATDSTAGWTQYLTGYAPERSGAWSINRYEPVPPGRTVFERLEDRFGSEDIVTGVITGVCDALVGFGPARRTRFEVWAESTRRRGLPVPTDPRVGMRVVGAGWIVESGGELYVAVKARPFLHAQKRMETFVNNLGGDDPVGDLALDTLDTYRDQRFFLFVHFAAPDRVGHAYGENSQEYNDAIIGTDVWTGRLIERLRQLGLYDQTLVYIAADHGFDEGQMTHRWAPRVFVATNDPRVRSHGDRADLAPTILKRFGVDPLTVQPPLDGVPLDVPAPAKAALYWPADTGFLRDGVQPNVGEPLGTRFEYRVRYLDPSGRPPAVARCVVERLDDTGWQLHRTATMRRQSGDPATGAVYVCLMQLPSKTFRYRFDFAAEKGVVVGDPLHYRDGPQVAGRARLCWTGQPGYETDGIDPDAAPGGSSFRFRVTYRDSGGDAPIVREVRLRRDGRPCGRQEMRTSTVWDYRTGQVFRATVRLTWPGAYEYRFLFADASGAALGPPNSWTAGPTVTGTSSVAVTAPTAMPTTAGAQVTFSLSAAANVSVTVVNVAARPIRTLVADKPLEAGLQTLLWDRRADTGLPVPAGLYLIRVTARGDEGGQSTSLATLALR